jgi:hypothetical protein
MSSRVGTLQAPRTGRPIWPVALLTALVVVTVGIAAVTMSTGTGTRDATVTVTEAERSTPGRSANTPSELSGGIVQGAASATAANTPSELSGGIVGGFEQPTGTSELTPAERYDLHQRI